SDGLSQQSAALIPGMHSPVAVRQQAISVAVDTIAAHAVSGAPTRSAAMADAAISRGRRAGIGRLCARAAAVSTRGRPSSTVDAASPLNRGIGRQEPLVALPGRGRRRGQSLFPRLLD